MLQPLQALSRLSERERRIVILGGIIAFVLLIFAVLMPLQRSVSASAQRIERKRGDLGWLQSVAPQLGNLSGSAPAQLNESMVALVDRTARDAGIGKSLVAASPAATAGSTCGSSRYPSTRW